MFILVALAVAGCSTADHGPRVVQRTPDPNDTPFGGGVPVSQHPAADPFGRESRRTEVRLDYRGDNGVPETRVDPRMDRRTQ